MRIQDLSYQLNNERICVQLEEQFNIQVSLEVISFENVYTIPTYQVLDNQFYSQSLVWGDTEQVDGEARLSIDKEKALLINASARLDKDIRGIKIRIDDLPLGKLISSTSQDEQATEEGLFLKYPDGWRTLSHPLLVFEIDKDRYLYIRCLDSTVNQKYFVIKKIGDKMRADIVQEQQGDSLSHSYSIPPIEVGITKTKEEIYQRQMEYIEKTFDVVPFEQSRIVPNWFKDVSLVVIMHMESFTGHIFHTYEQAYEDVKKLTEIIPGKNILVYFPGWEGRYYYKYGNYSPDERLGGEKALKECIQKIKEFGCKTMAMAGMNYANKNIPSINKIYKEAEFQSISGTKYRSVAVDFEGAHNYDFGELVSLNIANKKWADELFKQIKDFSLKYDFDGVFLDIASLFINDKNHALYPGVCEFCDRLRTIKPNYLVSGEGFYDGLLRAMPLFQATHVGEDMLYHDRINEELFNKYAREFGHLCLGDPSRGSTGVHELGENKNWRVPYRKGLIPTISLVDGSLELAPEKVKQIVENAIRYNKDFK